ncbi:MAG: sodium:calcium antiporter [SAR324 cluster bacterium]|jgi:cation:H+ antiporter|nr:sodium:calcium antiporter [SAR324 cluster bacterium]MDP6295852.1 sodium:calcium antiporter [SAR324 cluster bacterium]
MNPITPFSFFFGKDMFRHAILLSGIAIIAWFLTQNGIGLASYFFWISLIMISTIVIWRAGDFFSPAATYIQNKHDIPQSIKAAVIDAIASSFPEFCVAVIAVIMLGRAEVGIASIVGSALYNVLVIPAAAGLVAASPMVISKEVVWRDNLYYLGVTLLLGAMLWLFPNEWGAGVAVIFLLAYLGYVFLLQRDFKKSKNQNADSHKPDILEDKTEDDDELELKSEKKAWIWLVSMMILMGAATHVLVESSLALGDMLGIDGVLMGFVVIAAGTSVPDTALSVISAKKGHYDAAVSNVFGSNIFDICICLSVPILLALAMSGEPTAIDLPQLGLIWSLIGATFIAAYLFWSNNYTLTKAKAGMMGMIYLLIIFVAFSF